ncbi:beta-ketoacyl-ACP synthase II [Pediococcus pentosaceus]|uniref:3-oxoacyl-[acyl-carrier-protein] synthase 2 n=1 Tax=Pediococcus pentosaceus (strain ATCC 25745 / CCUG 21536 / LMG 10740 / 183-1w) TaxID=278197 RepID=Q03FV4_PEDPA|nr:MULTISPECIES: beta-ketoacyl-ACP synthase II [Pediococcus]ABJ67918.1 3-oxoacyl-[acyl-carrier-protein] synthase II [Pediococcus pentosaceus ATCC 25745]ANI97986.1 beta-ketoacyl-[acyl-carrier-protein] synthase II [Pediococcus pentosaceus]AVL01422.1 beta-ketoacyl-[acyl-carrier-protein] synthase II [Pediococcus pentosaceus]KAF5440891.1 beta-ketoacyl-ACP synthase II [Pediococcus sp. EKM202D]KAF5441546.1 beta-ketoacyl-ACP synthase II [Pediococcus sp. EKM201D]
MGRRVVVTGMGALTPLGNDRESFIQGLNSSKVGIDKITHFDAELTGITVAGEVKDFDPTVRIERKIAKRMDAFSQYALYSAVEAMEQADFKEGELDPYQVGVIYGSGIGGLTTIQEQVIKMDHKGPRRVSPLFVTNSITNMAAGNISMYFNAKNTSQAIVTACASANNAIGNAFHHIKNGYADVMITGGSESSINEIGIAGFASLTALTASEDRLRASIPFDKDRNGFVMGEGAATLILEDYDHAKARGANILAEIVGYGMTSDAFHMTQPDPEGRGAIRAMQMAMDEGGIKANDIDYINAHGTSTHANDSAESKAIESIFTENDHYKVSSTKSMTGHLLGAAGAIEAVATIAALQNGIMPVNVGLETKDPEVNIPLVTEDNRKASVNYALSNSFGFGGHNAVLAFKR